MKTKDLEVKFNEMEYQNNLKDFNRQWCDWWRKTFADRYKDNNLVQEIKTLETDINICISKIKSLQVENENLLDENIQLGIQIDDLKHAKISQVQQISELQCIVGERPKSIFDATHKLIQQRQETKMLQTENLRMKQSQMFQIEQKQTISSQGTILQATSTETVERILELKIQGMNYTEISKITKVSTATVSRYVQKNKKRLNQMQYLNDNSNI